MEFWYSKKLGKKYSFEVSGFRKFETPCYIDADFNITYDSRRRDHAPGIYFYFAAFGWMLIDLTLHNMHHATHPEPAVKVVKKKRCYLELNHFTDEEVDEILKCDYDKKEKW